MYTIRTAAPESGKLLRTEAMSTSFYEFRSESRATVVQEELGAAGKELRGVPRVPA